MKATRLHLKSMKYIVNKNSQNNIIITSNILVIMTGLKLYNNKKYNNKYIRKYQAFWLSDQKI